MRITESCSIKCAVLEGYGNSLNKVELHEFRERKTNPTSSRMQMQIVFSAIVFGSPFFSEVRLWSQQNFLPTVGRQR